LFSSPSSSVFSLLRNLTSWREKIKTTNLWIDLDTMRQCPSEYHCPAGKSGHGTRCATNIDPFSRMCTFCKTGFVFQLGECKSCNDGAMSSSLILSGVVLLIILLLIAVKVILSMRNRKKKKAEKKALENINKKPKTEAEKEQDIFHKYNKPIAIKIKVIVAYSQIIGKLVLSSKLRCFLHCYCYCLY
jgi:hypothetical protein